MTGWRNRLCALALAGLGIVAATVAAQQVAPYTPPNPPVVPAPYTPPHPVHPAAPGVPYSARPLPPGVTGAPVAPPSTMPQHQPLPVALPRAAQPYATRPASHSVPDYSPGTTVQPPVVHQGPVELHDEVGPPPDTGRKWYQPRWFSAKGCATCKDGHGHGSGSGRGPICSAFRYVFGCDCWAHHDEFGCSSFHADMRFIFGSCRAFFGETCPPGPPPVPVPPGYSLPPGPRTP
jgi:hypothetical protein